MSFSIRPSTYWAALDALIAPTRAAQLPHTLEPMRALMRRLGDPQRRFRSVVVAGSVGKTGMAHHLAAELRALQPGQRVGLYTSPHLHSFRERFVIDGQMIAPDEFAALWARVSPALHAGCSTFEAATALCLTWFAESNVDLAVLEIGLGGRFDAVNVVPNQLAVIMPLEMEHAAMLGGTIERIAWHKAGVIQPGGAVMVLPQPPEVLAVIEREIAVQGATLRHPVVAAASLPGRMEWAAWRGRPLLIDGAHTVGSARRLVEAVGSRSVCAVVGMLRDKPAADVLRAFDREGWRLLLTTAPATRAFSGTALAASYASQRAVVEVVTDADAALERGAALAGDLLLVTGSLRMAALARERCRLVTPEMAAEAAVTRAIYAAKNARL